MAADQLDRIAKLSAALAPLAGKQRGMRIEADDWNALVAAVKGVLEVDRAQEQVTSGALADAYAARIHEHLGNVSLAWLSTELQARIGDSATSLSVMGTVGELQRRLEASQQEVARLTAAVEDLQRRIDRTSVDEVDRTNRLRKYEDRITGLEDLRTSVDKATTTVDQLGPQIADVIALKGQLTDPAGNPVDLGAIRQDIANLEALRENLVGVTGETLRLQDFESQIADIREQLKQNAGDERFKIFERELGGKLDTKYERRDAETRTALLGEIEAGRDDTRRELRAGLEDVRAGVDQAVTARALEVETRITSTLDAREANLATSLRTELTAAHQAQLDAAVVALDTRTDRKLTALEGKFTRIVDTRITLDPGILGGGGGIIRAPEATEAAKPADRAATQAKAGTGTAASSRPEPSKVGPTKVPKGGPATATGPRRVLATAKPSQPPESSTAPAAKPRRKPSAKRPGTAKDG